MWYIGRYYYFLASDNLTVSLTSTLVHFAIRTSQYETSQYIKSRFWRLWQTLGTCPEPLPLLMCDVSKGAWRNWYSCTMMIPSDDRSERHYSRLATKKCVLRDVFAAMYELHIPKHCHQYVRTTNTKTIPPPRTDSTQQHYIGSTYEQRAPRRNRQPVRTTCQEYLGSTYELHTETRDKVIFPPFSAAPPSTFQRLSYLYPYHHELWWPGRQTPSPKRVANIPWPPVLVQSSVWSGVHHVEDGLATRHDGQSQTPKGQEKLGKCVGPLWYHESLA